MYIHPGRKNGKSMMYWNHIRRVYMAVMEDWILKSEDSYRYQLLSRLKSDCDYYLNYGNRSKNHLWAEDEKGQIETMKMLWKSFPDEDKPEWLTWEEILEYEEKMCGGENGTEE